MSRTVPGILKAILSVILCMIPLISGMNNKYDIMMSTALMFILIELILLRDDIQKKS